MLWLLQKLIFFHLQQSNSTPHSEAEDDKHSEDFQQSPPQKYLDESPPHDVSESFAQQQRELLERLKEQFTSFPFSHVPNFAGFDMPTEQAQQKSQTDANSEFSYSSFPTPPPSKGEDDLKASSASGKKSSQSNSSWSYEDQFKQVRQVSEFKRFKLQFNYDASINNRLVSDRSRKENCVATRASCNTSRKSPF